MKLPTKWRYDLGKGDAYIEWRVEVAQPRDEALVKACAKFSDFTKDFNNPPMSLKAMRKVAYDNKEVLVAVAKGRARAILGFCWVRPMKPAHMPFSTIYYIGVLPGAKGMGVGTVLMEAALSRAKNGRLELVTEHRNNVAMDFFESVGGEAMRQGTVGKDNRPYTRWAFTEIAQ